MKLVKRRPVESTQTQMNSAQQHKHGTKTPTQTTPPLQSSIIYTQPDASCCRSSCKSYRKHSIQQMAIFNWSITPSFHLAASSTYWCTSARLYEQIESSSILCSLWLMSLRSSFARVLYFTIIALQPSTVVVEWQTPAIDRELPRI